jgi:hypothetical protein
MRKTRSRKRFSSGDFQIIVNVLLIDVEKPIVSYSIMEKKETLRV